MSLTDWLKCAVIQIFWTFRALWWWPLSVWPKTLWEATTWTCYSLRASLEPDFMVAKTLQALDTSSPCWGRSSASLIWLFTDPPPLSPLTHWLMCRCTSSPLARLLFPAIDDNLLKHNFDDNQRVEPEWYIPIIPTLLINGAEGIGTGWASKIPNYDIREIIGNIHRMLHGEEPLKMVSRGSGCIFRPCSVASLSL